MTSPDVFFIFSEFWFFLLLGGESKFIIVEFFLKLGFTPCKAEELLWGMHEVTEKEAHKDQDIQEICLERSYS